MVASRIELELAIPKNVLAARMGFTPETLSRIFRELADGGFIQVFGKHVTLTEKFTRQYAQLGGTEACGMAAGGGVVRPGRGVGTPCLELIAGVGLQVF